LLRQLLRKLEAAVVVGATKADAVVVDAVVVDETAAAVDVAAVAVVDKLMLLETRRLILLHFLQLSQLLTQPGNLGTESYA
jgi:hypothetical protein